jgi:hypothetical protein
MNTIQQFSATQGNSGQKSSINIRTSRIGPDSHLTQETKSGCFPGCFIVHASVVVKLDASGLGIRNSGFARVWTDIFMRTLWLPHTVRQYLPGSACARGKPVNDLSVDATRIDPLAIASQWPTRDLSVVSEQFQA